MTRADVALIGGTGIGNLLDNWAGEPIKIQTECGIVDGTIVERDGLRLMSLRRHSSGHKTPPHLVNYRAMALALKQLEVRACVSSAAVGSLNVDWKPGTLAACDDFIDLTFRRQTLFDQEVVHTDFTTPFPLVHSMRQAAHELGHLVEPGAVYVGLDGPRYETPAEIRMLQKLGGDVVGMTASTESILMNEARVPYGCLAVVTNLGCGLGQDKLDHSEVVDVMKIKGNAVLDILWRTLLIASNG